MADLESLRGAIDLRFWAQAEVDTANDHLNVQHTVLSEVFLAFVGEVLPLAGIANSVIVSPPGDNDKEGLNGALCHIARRGILDSTPATFGPDYFKVNEVKADIVLLGHPNSTSTRTGLVALLHSIRLVSVFEIEEANRSRIEATAQ